MTWASRSRSQSEAPRGGTRSYETRSPRSSRPSGTVVTKRCASIQRASIAGSRSGSCSTTSRSSVHRSRARRQVIDDIGFCQAQVRGVRAGPARRDHRRRGGDASGRASRAPQHPDRERRRVRARRPLPDGRLRPHERASPRRSRASTAWSACTPPLGGALPAATIAAMHLAGADEIYVLGGVQAVAALALGTESIARSTSSSGRATRTSPRPSASCSARSASTCSPARPRSSIIADEHADPVIVAADLLGQAEHGPTSPAVLITTSQDWREAADARGRPPARSACRPPRSPASRGADYGEIHVVGRPGRGGCSSPTPTRSSTSRSSRASRAGTSSGCATTARCSSARGRPWPTATRRSAPTTSCRRPARRGTRGGLWVGKFLKTVTYQECDAQASILMGEICARQCRLENFEGHARSCDARVAKYRAGRRGGLRWPIASASTSAARSRTCCCTTSDSGAVRLAKVPSTPADQSEGVLRGHRRVCRIAGRSPADVDAILHGTTVATNAVLEGTGARVGLLVTRRLPLPAAPRRARGRPGRCSAG